ncbi:MAG: hypothetical protein Q8918_15145 [Bacteroidota bacterium]|nr:hypothetical protein [Bacteroidota bacterium]MDP4251437.1 hypothetical protein [Bacteroidota bacterium]
MYAQHPYSSRFFKQINIPAYRQKYQSEKYTFDEIIKSRAGGMTVMGSKNFEKRGSDWR